MELNSGASHVRRLSTIPEEGSHRSTDTTDGPRGPVNIFHTRESGAKAFSVLQIVYMTTGDLDAQRELLRAELKQQEQTLGARHMKTLMTLYSLSAAFYACHDLRSAEKSLLRLLRIGRDVFKHDRSVLSHVYKALTRVYTDQRKPRRAAYYRKRRSASRFQAVLASMFVETPEMDSDSSSSIFSPHLLSVEVRL